MVSRGVVFDMDDTLYLERDYVRSGFRAVAAHVSEQAEEEDIFTFLWSLFESGVRGDTFNRLFDAYPGLTKQYDIAALIEVYRNHTPDIEILPAMRSLLDGLQQKGVRLGVLSDGPLVSQQAKAHALGIHKLVDSVVLTDELGRDCWKPSPAGFKLLSETLGIEQKALTYIGDNPAKDFIAPNRQGWRTIRIRMEGQLHEWDEPADTEAAPGEDVYSVEALSRLLL